MVTWIHEKDYQGPLELLVIDLLNKDRLWNQMQLYLFITLILAIVVLETNEPEPLYEEPSRLNGYCNDWTMPMEPKPRSSDSRSI